MAASPQPVPSRPTFLPSTLHATELPGLGALAAPAQLLAAWHLLSFDAPTVAALWVVFVARCAGISLPWTEPAAMFVAVWILYAADRLLDARRAGALHSARDLESRHRFHDQHRRAFYVGLVLACPLLATLLLHANPSALRLNFLLGGLLLLWLLVIHLRSPASTRLSRLPKELAVGVFFPAAIFIPCVARVPELRPALLPDAILFAAVCSLNCLYIFVWEHPFGCRQAHGTTRWAVRRLPQLTAATVTAALTVAVLYCTADLLSILPGNGRDLLTLPAFACAASAVLLLVLHRSRHALSPVLLRATADVCLLTPVLVLLTRPVAGHL